MVASTAASKVCCLVEWKVVMMVGSLGLWLAVYLVDRMAVLKVYDLVESKVSMKVESLALLMVDQMAVRLVCYWDAKMGL